MSNIKISRYAAPTDEERAEVTAAMRERGNTQTESPFPADDWGGIIEPEDKSWIIFLDIDGKPSHYYPERDSASGGVMCDPVLL